MYPKADAVLFPHYGSGQYRSAAAMTRQLLSTGSIFSINICQRSLRFGAGVSLIEESTWIIVFES